VRWLAVGAGVRLDLELGMSGGIEIVSGGRKPRVDHRGRLIASRRRLLSDPTLEPPLQRVAEPHQRVAAGLLADTVHQQHSKVVARLRVGLRFHDRLSVGCQVETGDAERPRPLKPVDIRQRSE
jgi:hypothetical protein